MQELTLKAKDLNSIIAHFLFYVFPKQALSYLFLEVFPKLKGSRLVEISHPLWPNPFLHFKTIKIALMQSREF